MGDKKWPHRQVVSRECGWVGGSWPTGGGRGGSHCLQVSLACHILGASDERAGLENTVYVAGLSSKCYNHFYKTQARLGL